MPILQKPLGWVQRYLYNIEQGPLPHPQIVLPIDQDWPLEIKSLRTDYATVAGSTVQNLYEPGNEKHGLVWVGDVVTLGAAFPATDAILFNLLLPDGATVNLSRIEGSAAAVNRFPLINFVHMTAALVTQVLTVAPVYVPAGGTLRVAHTSVAGGINARLEGGVIERLKSYPLRLP